MDSLSRHEDYGALQLSETELDPDPFVNLANWLRDAEAAAIFEPNAFVLGTVDAEGKPTARTVLLKSLDHGLVFVSNYESRKGHALESHPGASAVFPWYSLYRQVIVEGVAERVTGTESDDYFASRPHGSQVAAWASDQSRAIESREALDARYESMLADAGETVSRPPHWGGFRLVPNRIEFWKGRSNRMHDRIVFTQVDGAWSIMRLQP